MLKLDLKRACEEKGIDNPNKFLRSLGFSTHLSSRLLTGYYAHVHLKYIEPICIALNCTIDDLVTWTPDKTKDVPANHVIHKLKIKNENTITQKLTKLPFDKIGQVHSYLDSLNAEEKS